MRHAVVILDTAACEVRQMPTAHSFKTSTFDRLETAADEAIAVYGCDMRGSIDMSGG
jgi:hypothetical protein